MFIIKAETRQAGSNGAGYSMYDAERVRVAKSTIAGTDPVPYPELEVWLYDASGHEKAILYVGHGLDHFSHVYIMNANGKTVDSVYPGPAPATTQANAPITVSGPGYAASFTRAA
jgi:hypothetical protein